MILRDRVLEGVHNGITFIWADGYLEMFGRRFSNKEIKTLVEVANLLKIEGRSLKENLPATRTGSDFFNAGGRTV